MGISISTRQARHLRTLHIEDLKIQREHLLIMRDRHRMWITESDDSESKPIRREIIDLIDKAVDQYDHLLEALQSQEDEG